MNARPPVSDWKTDFDPLDFRWIEDPFPIWDELRRGCPIAHTDRFNGVYFPSRYEDVRAIAYDTKHFSSRRVVVRETKVAPHNPPITSDPPEHRPGRMILLPPFTPKAVKSLEPVTRTLCRKLIERVAELGRADLAVDYAQEIPVRVIARMLGLPDEEGDQFRRWIYEAYEAGITDAARYQRAYQEMSDYFVQKIAERRAQPGNDLISYLLAAKLDGSALSDDHVVGTLRLLLVAGIDTTWSAIGASLWHLSKHADDRRRLAAEPLLIPTAVEEFLRAYAPVTMAREVAEETTLNGCRFEKGQMVLLSFPAANRDPAVFPDADRVVVDRVENRHAAFGLGIHRCIGSNLARMEMVVALEEWLKRVPEFTLDETAEVKWSEGIIRGPRRVPVIFD